MKSALRLLLACASLLIPSAWADRVEPQDLLALHQQVGPGLERPDAELPFYLQAARGEKSESGVAALYLPQSIETLATELSEVANWCDILPLHINVKACTYQPASNELTIYMGRKHYQPPDAAFELVYRLETRHEEGYFRATATAEKGPLNTGDYRIELEFMRIGERTFGRIHVSNRLSWLSEKAMDVYLSTLGKDKRGIKVVDHDKAGGAVYSSGAAGVAERNLVRYYFAFMAYFDHAREASSVIRYEKQLQDWFARTETYPQLYEMSEQDYLSAKRRERINQLALQEKLSDAR